MILQERTQLVEGMRVDREAGRIHGVKIIGTKSANGRVYPIDVLTKAAPLYEGATVNIDHPRGPDSNRSVADTFGTVRNVTVKPSGAEPGLYADLEYLKSHPMAAQVAESAERFPNKIGLSHNADGRGSRDRNGTFLVESIDKVISVDLVKEPATNKSLFEGVQTVNLRTIKLSEMIGTLPVESHERRLLTRMVEEGAMSGETMAATSDQPGPEEAIKAAFRAEIIKAFDDTSLDAKATLARIKEVIKAHEKVQSAMAGTKAAGESGGAETSAEKKPENAQESQQGQDVGKLMEEIKLLRARDEVRTLLQEAKKEVTPAQFDALVATPAAHRKALLEGLGATQQPQGAKPRTVGTSQATGGTNGKPEWEKGDRFMEHLKRGSLVGSLGGSN